MANEIRLRRNNESGTITDNPLAIGATTINSAAFATLPTVDGSNHLILILDPQEVGGSAEIVRVTAHTAAATSVTVTRGQEGSVARSHVFNTTWMHGPVTSDYIEVLTSSTRPSVPYEGELIYETDTNKFVGFGGVDWAPRDAGGQLGYAEKTATDQTGITALTDLTGLSVTVTVGTGRRIRVTGYLIAQQITNTGTVELHIREGSTTLERSVDTVAAGSFLTCRPTLITSPSAGVHTYKLSLTSSAASVGTAYTGTGPAYILVEDIGAA